MFALQRSLSFGYFRQHRTRTVLVLFSIALGVATLVATRALNATLNQATKQAANPLSNLADLLVLNAQTGVPRSLADKLRKARVEGVQDVQPLILGRVAVHGSDNKLQSIQLIGLDWSHGGIDPGNRQPQDNAWRVTVEPDVLAGLGYLAFPKKPWALLSGKLADEITYDLGGFSVRGPAGDVRLLRLGTIRFPESKGLESGGFIVVDLDAGAKLAYPGHTDTVTQLNVQLTPEARQDSDAVENIRRQFQEIVGELGNVRTLDANYEMARDVTAGLELGFAIGGAGALVVGLFLVYNALSVSVAERRRDIGMLRAVGASRGQIVWLFLGEAVLLGLVGSVAGIPLGWGLAHVALGPLQSVLNDIVSSTEPLPINIPLSLMGLAIAAGIGTALLAALLPAVQAAEEEPAEAVRRSPRPVRLIYWLLHLTAVGLLLATGVAAVVFRAYLPVRVGVFAGIVFILIGAVVAMPLLSELLGHLLLPLVRPFLRLEGRLAADNLVRSPGRTGIVIAALAATGALMVQTAGFVRSTEEAIRGWIDGFVAADLFVTCGGSIHTTSAAQPMDEKYVTLLRKELHDDVVAALGVRFHPLEFRDRFVFLLAVDADAFADVPDSPYARNLGRDPRLKSGPHALVSENFATLNGLKPGDHFQVRGRNGLVDLEIIGTVLDYAWNRGTITVNREWFKKEFADSEVDLIDLYLRPGSDPEAVRQKLEERWSRSDALFAATRAEVHDDITKMLYRVYHLSYAQQGVVGVVTLLGVASALFISVLHRRRELGLLRAVGASRGQVLWTVTAEALLMGLVGAVIGFVIGLVLEWYVVSVMVWDEAGFTFPLVVPWLAITLVLVLSTALATLVGLWPAYIATRLRIPDAIAYE
jgi:putative ABC transport system permease protein